MCIVSVAAMFRSDAPLSIGPTLTIGHLVLAGTLMWIAVATDTSLWGFLTSNSVVDFDGEMQTKDDDLAQRDGGATVSITHRM